MRTVNGPKGDAAVAVVQPKERMACALRTEIRIPIRSSDAIIQSRLRGRELAESFGFTSTEMTTIVTAISELALNIVSYAGKGAILLGSISEERQGLVVMAENSGPGIPNLHQALLDGFSTSGGLGIGLPGVRRLMDDFRIESEVDQGTVVMVTKWKQ